MAKTQGADPTVYNELGAASLQQAGVQQTGDFDEVGYGHITGKGNKRFILSIITASPVSQEEK